jgi:5-methylcytosine-specific restriction endonuclease McrA
MIAIETNGRDGATDSPTDGTSGSPAQKITVARLRRLLEKQAYKCNLTGRELTPDTAAADHIKPLSSGGKNEMSNMQILHVDVNRAKGTMSRREFVDLCREVVKHADD